MLISAPTLEAPSSRLPAADDPMEFRGEVDLAYRQLYRTASDLRSMVGRYRETAQALTQAHHTSLVRLAQAVEFKDGDTGLHIIRMGQLSARLAHHLGLSAEECELICRAAPMHDIGKIAVPDEILKKAGPLTEVEWQIMRLHPEVGARLLYRDDARVFQLAAEIALAHHEKWDGSGYPHGQRGDRIPLPARIVALIDFFDALTRDRCYRAALPDELVFAMITEQRGRHFDPLLVDTFFDHQDEFITLRHQLNLRHAGLHEIDLAPHCFHPVAPVVPAEETCQ